ncbi:MAG: TolC family protein [Pyrinomonadaceae bacterium]
MRKSKKKITEFCAACVCALALPYFVFAQNYATSIASPQSETREIPKRRYVTSVIESFYDPQTGFDLNLLIAKAIATNGEIEVARIEVQRAEALMLQTTFRDNPTLEFETTSGTLLGNRGNGGFAVGFSMPLDIAKRRAARVEQARAEIEYRKAVLGEIERKIAGKVIAAYAESLAQLREIEVLEALLEKDTETARFVQIRVNEGETPPLELNQLQTEIEAMRAGRELGIGQMLSAISNLKFYAGISQDAELKLGEKLDVANVSSMPTNLEACIEFGLKNRPELAIYDRELKLAETSLELAKRNAKPEYRGYTRYSQTYSRTDLPAEIYPPAEYEQSANRTITFGVAVALPVFNKNEGAIAESSLAIQQAQARRDFAERMIRAEITAAYRRWEGANNSVNTFRSAVVPRAEQNVATVRSVYEIGEIKITDLISEQKRYLESSRNLSDAYAERYRAAGDLFNAIGAKFGK